MPLLALLCASTVNIISVTSLSSNDQNSTKQPASSSILSPLFGDSFPTLSKFGDCSVVALRVIVLDAEITSGTKDISNEIFGTYGKKFTMKSQFDSCSYGKFEPAAFLRTTKTGINLTNGTTEINIRINANGRSTGNDVDVVLLQAKKDLGKLNKKFVFVMLFLPLEQFKAD